MFTDFFFYTFLFVLKEMFNQLPNREGLIDMFWTRHNCQKHRIDQKTMSKPFFFAMLGRYDGHVLFSSFHFVPTSIHPLAWLSTLCMPVQHSRGPPGEQTHTAKNGPVPQSPSPSPFPLPLCLPSPVPPCPCLYAPPVCLMTSLLIRPEAPRCPPPGASTSLSYKVSLAVSQMG